MAFNMTYPRFFTMVLACALVALVFIALQGDPAVKGGGQPVLLERAEAQEPHREVSNPAETTAPRVGTPERVLVESSPSVETILTPSLSPVERVESASIIGQVVLPATDVGETFSILVEGRREGDRGPARFRELELRRDEGSFDSNTVMFAWNTNGLKPGEYQVVYGGAAVEAFTLLPGVNEINTSLLGDGQMEVLFVDEASGLPVSAKRCSWASLLGGATVVKLFGLGLKQSHMLFRVGESVSLKDIRGDRLILRVSANGYRTRVLSLRLSDGPVQVVELEPVFRLVVNPLGEDGVPIARFSEPGLGQKVALRIDGERIDPIQSGMNREGIYADFVGVNCAAGKWDVILPKNYKLIRIDSASIGPGTSASIDIW